MANWFKLYETDLDETRMRYALTKLPEVWPVWTGILMECCKHRSQTLRWGENELELFGFSDRLRITIPKVNEAIRLLCEIDYIKRDNGTLFVVKWPEKQSDYMSRDAKGYWKKRKRSRRVTDIHSDSRIFTARGEERRGDEKRVENTSNGNSSVVAFKRPSIDEVKLLAAKAALPLSEAEKFFDHYESNGWKVGRNPMRSLPHAISNWQRNWKNKTYENHNRSDNRSNDRNQGTYNEGTAHLYAHAAIKAGKVPDPRGRGPGANGG